MSISQDKSYFNLGNIQIKGSKEEHARAGNLGLQQEPIRNTQDEVIDHAIINQKAKYKGHPINPREAAKRRRQQAKENQQHKSNKGKDSLNQLLAEAINELDGSADQDDLKESEELDTLQQFDKLEISDGLEG